MPIQPYNICEYGIIRSKKDYPETDDVLLRELYLSANHFDSLYDYISRSQDLDETSEKPFALSSKGRKRQIRVKNYVGVIETKDGLHLDILPKIHLEPGRDELQKTKQLFLKMLRHLKDSPFINIDTAHLNTTNDFPLLEVFIKSYVEELEKILTRGIKHDYILHEENVRSLKGKVKITENIRRNRSDQSHFYCEFSDYSPNIPLNRLIKSTLFKLIRISKSHRNVYSINKLLGHLQDVSFSTDVTGDFAKINPKSRQYFLFQTIIKWSEIFLMNRSFTNFSGDDQNIAILFPMEKVFEDYMGYLFKKFGEGLKIKTQDKSYFLIEEHRGQKKFGLRPDIVLEGDGLVNRKIVDVKWKLLDETAERRNYNITQADMYQLYAYGRKYVHNGAPPRLVLLYPSNTKFKNKLEQFIYEGDLRLEIVPFNFEEDEKEQIDLLVAL